MRSNSVQELLSLLIKLAEATALHKSYINNCEQAGKQKLNLKTKVLINIINITSMNNLKRTIRLLIQNTITIIYRSEWDKLEIN